MDENKNAENWRYGCCPRCGGKLYPVYFKDEETVVRSGHYVKTGRVRTAVDYLYCRLCGDKEPVDDTFDGQWHFEN